MTKYYRCIILACSLLLPSVCLSQVNEILPMYGGMDRYSDPVLAKEDAAFIAQATLEFSSAELASNGYVESGFDYFAKDQYDKSVMRFNQAWLLDKNNPYVYVGYGVVYNKKQEYCQAMDMFNIAYDKQLSEAGFLADYGLTVSRCALTKQEQDKTNLFAISEQLFEQAIETLHDQVRAYAYQQWARSALLQNRIDDAESYISKAKNAGINIDAQLLNDIKHAKQ